MNKTHIIAGFLALSVFMNAWFVYTSFLKKNNPVISNKNEIITQENYPLLSPRLFVENQNDRLINFIDLRTKLQEFILPHGTKIGMYFEYLPSGVSIGINEKNGFFLASLLKTPLAMAAYRQIESGKTTPSTVLTIEESYIDDRYGDLWKKGAGTKLTVNEAIRYILAESDNTAYQTLYAHLAGSDADFLSHVFDSLDIPRERANVLPVVTPKNYSSIMRSLYLSSYLTLEHSNELLTIMTHSKFRDRIQQNIPNSVPVAHKIATFETESGANIYSDCGIIYTARRPYILCIMTRNIQETQANSLMSEISTIVYNYVSTINGDQK